MLYSHIELFNRTNHKHTSLFMGNMVSYYFSPGFNVFQIKRHFENVKKNGG